MARLSGSGLGRVCRKVTAVQMISIAAMRRLTPACMAVRRLSTGAAASRRLGPAAYRQATPWAVGSPSEANQAPWH